MRSRQTSRAKAFATVAALALAGSIAGAATAPAAHAAPPGITAKPVHALSVTYVSNRYGSLIIDRDRTGHVTRVTTSPGARVDFFYNGWLTGRVYTNGGQDRVGLNIPATSAIAYFNNGGSLSTDL